MSKNRGYDTDDNYLEGYEFLKKKFDKRNKKANGIRKFRKNRDDY